MNRQSHGSRVLVTGPNGFLGQYVVNELAALGCEIVKVSGFDLLQETQALTAILTTRPEIVIHLAAPALRPVKEQGTAFRETLRMGMNVLDASVLVGARFVTVAPRTVYANPSFFGAVKSLPETYFHLGPPQDGVGEAKRAIAAACGRYQEQHGRSYAVLVLSSLYGPFEPASPLKNGVGFMVKSILDCMDMPEFAFSGMKADEQVECLYAQDAAEAIVKATFADFSGVINIPAGGSVSRFELAALISKAAEYEGKIHLDSENSIPVPRLSGELAEKLIGWKAQTELAQGLLQTVEWFSSEKTSLEVEA